MHHSIPVCYRPFPEFAVPLDHLLVRYNGGSTDSKQTLKGLFICLTIFKPLAPESRGNLFITNFSALFSTPKGQVER